MKLAGSSGVDKSFTRVPEVQKMELFECKLAKKIVTFSGWTLVFLCFVHEVYKKVVYVHILVPLCMCRKFYNRLSLPWTKNKDVNALRNDCQNDRQDHVQYDESTSKIKKLRGTSSF